MLKPYNCGISCTAHPTSDQDVIQDQQSNVMQEPKYRLRA